MRYEHKRHFWWHLICLTALLLSYSWPAAAAPLVSAQASQPEANAGIVQMTIASPAPSSVIVSLTLPDGYQILSANPDFKKRSKKHREIKWLLKDVAPGSRAISFVLSAPFTFSQLNCIVQYMDPTNGRMVTLRVGD